MDLFSLRIHCWGGLGSQLYAIHLALLLRESNPSRKIHLVFHTSGVTHRELEISPKDIPFFVSTVDDFRKPCPADKKAILQSPLFSVRSKIRVLLEKIGIMGEFNTDDSLTRISKFLLSTRGHYSGLSIDKKKAKVLWGLLFQNSPLRVHSNTCAIHLRLGDLLLLKEKTPIKPESLQFAINAIRQIRGKIHFTIYSDSNKEQVIHYLAQSGIEIEFEYRYSDSRQMVWDCTEAEYFIGSTSKLSIWICVFRNLFWHETNSYLPQQYSKGLRNTDVVFF